MSTGGSPRGGDDDPERIRLARIALGHVVEPGSRDLGEAVAEVGVVAALRRLMSGTIPGRVCAAAASRLRDVDPYRVGRMALRRADRLGVRIITPEDPEWTPQLADLETISRDGRAPVDRDTHPPQCLWVRGPLRLDEACDRSVAVVGARASTSYGNHVAGELSYGLAERGWTVVSGGAFGIDAAAHRAALAAGGVTVAVLACGIDRPYPVSHTSLFDRIADEGLLVSEWPPGADPHRHRFLVRNRVIAALTRGTVVVEANRRSGARFTLGRARLLRRHCLAVPGPVTSAMSVGCHDELRTEGTILVTDAAQVIEAVGRIGTDLAPWPERGEASPLDALTALQAQVLDGVRPRKALSAEEIAAAAGVSARDARRTLPTLEELGFVVAHGGGYRLAGPGRPGPGGA
jgi:DNA processing protein